MAQLAHFYGLPVYINVGLTDSKLPDAQAGLEAGVTLAAARWPGPTSSAIAASAAPTTLAVSCGWPSTMS